MPAASARRKSGSNVVVVVIAGLAIVGVAAAGIHLASGGEIVVPFTNPPRIISLATKADPVRWSPPAGKVGVPISARPIAAYSMVTRDDLFSPKLGRVTFLYAEPGSFPADLITDIEKVRDRVLAHDKGEGYPFRESDFLPKGTRPGLVGGIPPNMRAYRLELSKVRGFFGLKPGDRFDLLASLPVGDPVKDLKKYGGAYAERMALEASLASLDKQANVRVIVQNGVVVTPVETVQIPVSGASLTGGRTTKSKPIQEVVIAIHPNEVSPLAAAVAVDAELSVVPRSGRPDDPVDSVTPELRPRSPFSQGDDSAGASASLRFVETIGGSKRELIPIPPSVQPAEAEGGKK